MVYCFKVCLDLILRETTYNRGVLAREVLPGVLGESNHSVQSMCRSWGLGASLSTGILSLEDSGALCWNFEVSFEGPVGGCGLSTTDDSVRGCAYRPDHQVTHTVRYRVSSRMVRRELLTEFLSMSDVQWSIGCS